MMQPLINTWSGWDGPRSLLNDVCERKYPAQQESIPHLLRAKPEHRWYIQTDSMESLTDSTINETVARFKDIPERCAWLFETAGGAVADVRESETCVPERLRKAPWMAMALHQWPDPSDGDQRWTDTAEIWMKEVIEPHSAGGPLPCFFTSKTSRQKIINTYGEKNFRKLEEIRKGIDPDRVWRNNFWPVEE